MNILAFESSCDETAVAVVRDGRTLLSDAILSQADMAWCRRSPPASTYRPSLP